MRKLALVLLLANLVGCGDQDSNSDGDFNFNESASRSFGSPLLSRFDSCESLANDLRRTALEEMRTQLEIKLKNGYDHVGIAEDGLAIPTAAPAAGIGKDSSAPVEGVDFSGTNNQEKDVDEADIIKFDGKYFYILNKNTIEIVAVPEPGQLEKASTLELPSSGNNMLILNNMAIVIATDHNINIAEPRDGVALLSMPRIQHNNMRIDIIDLSADRSSPSLIESHYFEGNAVAARKVGDKVHIATYARAEVPDVYFYPELPENFYQASDSEKEIMWREAIEDRISQNQEKIEDFDFLTLLPAQLQKNGDKFNRQEINIADCQNTYGQEIASSNGFLSLISIDPEKSQTTLNIHRVRGNQPIVYASENQFILASSEHSPWWFYNNEELKDQTTIHRFDIPKDSLPEYVDSARVPGTLHNSFSISEHEGYLRLATTTKAQGRFWLDLEPLEEENHLFILGDETGDYDILSSIEGLAPGEKIWSARFSKDKGFLVTFKQVDPLFTLDLSDPFNPELAGELKIPGVSTYLQDIGNDNLLAVGYGGTEEGLDFKTTISLFDTSDFENPELADTLSFAIEEDLDHSWSRVSSEANNNHLAINYFGKLSMTAIPVSTDRFVANPLDPSGGTWEYLSKLTLVKTEPGQDLEIHGHVDHSEFYKQENSSERRPPQIRRSYFHVDENAGDFIYAISPKAITATNIASMEQSAAYILP